MKNTLTPKTPKHCSYSVRFEFVRDKNDKILFQQNSSFSYLQEGEYSHNLKQVIYKGRIFLCTSVNILI